MAVSEVQAVVIDVIAKLYTNYYNVNYCGDHISIGVGWYVTVRLFSGCIVISDYGNGNVGVFDYCQFDESLEFLNDCF